MGEKIMPHDLENTLALLGRTPMTLDALLRGMPEIWTDGNEGEGTWNVRAVLAHLINADRVNWIPRAKHILEHGETRPFEPFNREGGSRENQSVAELLDEFTRQRAQKLAELRALRVESPDLGRHGYHPALGTVTLSQLLATWAAHDLTHLHQISRIMAHQYRDAVGPWSKFLGVLHCQGHSQPA
jgi:DinB superfamily